MRRLGQILAILAVLLAGLPGYGQAGAASPSSAVASPPWRFAMVIHAFQ